MRTLTLIPLLLALTLSGRVQAQTHFSCSEQMAGLSTCHDSDGNLYTVQKDPFGATVTDDEGHTSRIERDGIGGTTIRREDGSVVRGRKDIFGDTVYEDEHGRQTHCRRSPIALPGQTDMDCRQP
ncbi:MAG TPA: hypothetical protein VG960_12130 [Caulobacteraceae bacterium]|nr:hypothetical protein [Caulobacteraceae bacterium]